VSDRRERTSRAGIEAVSDVGATVVQFPVGAK
jgi:hypothetical protein